MTLFHWEKNCSYFLQVAKESAAKFNPHVKLEAHHANIKDPQFNIEWFQNFSLVFNALDNLDARRHVNKMCLAADVALIESGTTGFNGQVQPIIKVSRAENETSQWHQEADSFRAKPNATTAVRKRCPRASLSAQSGAPLVSQYIA